MSDQLWFPTSDEDGYRAVQLVRFPVKEFSNASIRMDGHCFIQFLVICIEHGIVKNRDTIVRYGRQLQQELHLPRPLHIFAEADPGILELDVWIASWGLLSTGYFSLIGFVCLFGEEGDLGNTMVAFGFVMPPCHIILIWLWLSLGRRRLDRSAHDSSKCGNRELETLLPTSEDKEKDAVDGQDVHNEQYQVPAINRLEPIEWNWRI